MNWFKLWEKLLELVQHMMSDDQGSVEVSPQLNATKLTLAQCFKQQMAIVTIPALMRLADHASRHPGPGEVLFTAGIEAVSLFGLAIITANLLARQNNSRIVLLQIVAVFIELLLFELLTFVVPNTVKWIILFSTLQFLVVGITYAIAAAKLRDESN